MPDKKLIRDFFEAVNARDIENMEAALHADATFFFPQTKPLVGRDRILRFFHILFRQFPELIFDIQRVISEGDWVAVHWTNRGTSRKKESYKNEGVTLLQTEAEGIRFMSDFFKNTEKF
jgi:ketosteroid isomerase-like protein